jgi:acyl-CoA thioesterase FadM
VAAVRRRRVAAQIGGLGMSDQPGQADRIVTPYEGSARAALDPTGPIDAPLRLHRTVVKPAWVDYNGHMSESCYLLAFGDSADAFFRLIGIDEGYRAAGRSLYTVETHMHNRREVSEGEPLELTLQVLDYDRKRIHIFHEMRHGETGDVVATGEQLLVHVDMAAGRSAELPAEIAERVAAIHRAHAVLPTPDVVGKPMGIRR